MENMTIKLVGLQTFLFISLYMYFLVVQVVTKLFVFYTFHHVDICTIYGCETLMILLQYT